MGQESIENSSWILDCQESNSSDFVYTSGVLIEKKIIDPDFSQECSLFGFLNICQIFIKIRKGIINTLDVLLRTG